LTVRGGQGAAGASRAGPPRETSRRTRVAAAVLIGAVVAWMALSWAGGALGWPVGLAFVFDLACLAALVWALNVFLGAWRMRRAGDG
jgi:hypothetical protein